ncbi:MAG: hypothetical protein SGILL_007180 [Bacillariaceae sp.]
MMVHFPDENDDENVTPLFKLQDGVATSSAGLACAKHAGMETEVTGRARDVLRMMRRSQGIQPLPELTGEPTFADAEVDLLQQFCLVENWGIVGDDELRQMLQKVACSMPMEQE